MTREQDGETPEDEPLFWMSYVSTLGNKEHRRELERRLKELEAEGKA